MSVEHNHSRVNIQSKSGPARMATRQDEFRVDIERRLKALRKVLERTVVDNDALLLGKPEIDSRSDMPVREQINQPPELEDMESFGFETSEKVVGFREWWVQQIERALGLREDNRSITNGNHWTAPYIDTTYERGIVWANARSREEGVRIPEGEVSAVVRRPPHLETLRTLYNRTFNEVKSVGSKNEAQVSRLLAEGIDAGISPRRMGDILTNEVDDIRRKNGRMVARTEMMNAFHQGTGKRMQELGVEWGFIATFNPCPACRAYHADGPHPLDQLMRDFPLHPNCVCAIVPAPGPDAEVPTGLMGGS